MKKSSFSTTNPNKSRLWHNILTFFVGGFQRERVPFSVLWRIGIFWKILFNGNNLAISFHWVLSSVVVKCCLKIHIILEFMGPIKIPGFWIKPRSPPWLNQGSWIKPTVINRFYIFISAETSAENTYNAYSDCLKCDLILLAIRKKLPRDI